MVLGLVEETVVGQSGWFNPRIVAVCAAGLVAGPGVGVVVAAFVTWLAVAYHGRPMGPVGVSMLCGGLAGGTGVRSFMAIANGGFGFARGDFLTH
jgi:hypothetical protein